MTDRALNYQIDGNNRGGTVHAELLLRKLPDRKKNLSVVLNDIEPGRADKLARRLADHGISVAPHERPASVSPDTDIHTLSVDNPAPVVPILHSAVQSPLLEIGQLVAPSPSGGSIFGIAVVLTDSDPSKRSDALHIFSRLASLAGERKSSRAMSSPIRHSVQMSPIRNVMHDYLTDKSLQFMDNGLVPAELRFFDGLNRASYPVETVEAGRRIKRRDLKGATVSDLAPTGVNGNFCVVFYDRSEAWLYAVFATSRGDRARVARRKSIGRAWWNREWLNRQFALMHFLSEGHEEIAVGDTEGRVVLSARPLSGAVDQGIDEAFLDRIRVPEALLTSSDGTRYSEDD